MTIKDDVENRHPARAMLDSGSESNFITERLTYRVDISVAGIGQAATKVRQRLRAVVRSRVSDFSRALGFLVLPKVAPSLPTTVIKTETWTQDFSQHRKVNYEKRKALWSIWYKGKHLSRK